MQYIKDAILGDYYIVLDEYNFSAYKVITPDSGIPYDTYGHQRIVGRYTVRRTHART